MIISRTPFRVSFLGGGTDLPEFYREEEGAVLSCTFDKYMYLTVNDRFDSTFRLSYSKTEICESVDQIEHPILRYVLQRYAKDAMRINGGRGLEVLSMADVPSGTGLGSSSAFAVGLLHAMKAHNGVFSTAEQLAAEAAEIEIEKLHEPIGKQDQYAAAYGGLRYIRFKPSGEVVVEPVICSEKTRRELESSLLLFYTGTTRAASTVLKEQKAKTSEKRESLREMKNLADRLRASLQADEPIAKAGDLLHQGWVYKKSLASGVSSPQIDDWYARARQAGAWGGKILGAGGGGFLMVLCPPDRQASVAEALSELRPMPIRFESQGSKIIFVS